ncbi:MAG: hypothetical protein AAB683_00775 [Patescibacteria group bacterium]
MKTTTQLPVHAGSSKSRFTPFVANICKRLWQRNGRGFKTLPEEQIKLPAVQQPLVLDFTVNVDRQVKPVYPEWMKSLIYPNLEHCGPSQYDLKNSVTTWRHEGQKDLENSVSGHEIHAYIKDKNMLGSALNLQDGLAIQKMDPKVFRKCFPGQKTYLWASVLEHSLGDIFGLPFVTDGGKNLTIGWDWLGMVLVADAPGLFFKSFPNS